MTTLSLLILAILLAFGAMVLTGSEFRFWRNNEAVGNNNGDGVKRVSVFKEIAKPVYLPPVKIHFKEKTLQVEEVDVEKDGFLGVPSTWQAAGWYKEGARPGEEGNVIVDGHYDTNTGAPGAFWELKDLQVGDKVFLTDKLGRVFAYSVNSKSYISINDPERSKVFASDEDKILTLITCGGVWDYGSNTYNKRFVITAAFAKMEKKW